MSKIWSNRAGTHLIHADDLVELKAVCEANQLEYEVEVPVGEKPEEELLLEIVTLLETLVPNGPTYRDRMARIRLLADVVREEVRSKSIFLPEWRSLNEVEVVFIQDPGGKRCPHDVKKLMEKPHGLLAARSAKPGLRSALVFEPVVPSGDDRP